MKAGLLPSPHASEAAREVVTHALWRQFNCGQEDWLPLEDLPEGADPDDALAVWLLALLCVNVASKWIFASKRTISAR